MYTFVSVLPRLDREKEALPFGDDLEMPNSVAPFSPSSMERIQVFSLSLSLNSNNSHAAGVAVDV